MMREGTLCLGVLLMTATAGLSDDGLVRVPSSHDVQATADRLENALASKGMTVFARIDHAAGASQAGLRMRPTQVVIFGNPKVGTPLMHCAQSVAIDLPQKALIWEDEEGDVFLAYNDPAYLARRHAVTGCDEVLAKIGKALAAFAAAATERDTP